MNSARATRLRPRLPRCENKANMWRDRWITASDARNRLSTRSCRWAKGEDHEKKRKSIVEGNLGWLAEAFAKLAKTATAPAKGNKAAQGGARSLQEVATGNDGQGY